MKRMTYVLPLLCGFLLVLSGCGPQQQQYKARSLDHVTHKTAQYIDTKDDITVQVRKFTEHDNRTYFGEQSKFSENGIQPIQVTVKNDRQRNSVSLSPGNINLNIADTKLVRHSLACGDSDFNVVKGAKYSGITFLSAFSSIFVSIFLFPGYFVAIGPRMMLFHPIIGLLESIMIGAPLPMFVAGGFIGAYNAGRNDLRKKILDKKVVVRPRNQSSKVLFVQQSDYKNNFDVKVKNSRTKKDIVFHVNLGF